MNAEKTIRNSIFSLLGQTCTLLLQFVNRRVFIHFLDIEYLGYTNLFGNVFSMLSVAELGIGSIICFHLYKEIAVDNREEIGKLMYLYKIVYYFIASLVFVLGCICFIFIPYIVKDSTLTRSYLAVIYFFQLVSVVFGYFLSYRRTLLIANQKEYKCVQYDVVSSIFIQVIQLCTLALFKNYLLYLALQLSTSFIANILIYLKTNKDYPYLKSRYHVEKEDIIRRNFIPDIKNFLAHRISSVIYGGTDSIVISAFVGVRSVALYGNYYVLERGVLMMIYKLVDPLQATIGNIIYSGRTKEELWKQFEVLDFFGYLLATYVGTGFFLFFQPTIRIWLGRDFLLPYSFVVVFSITIYISVAGEMVYKYRSAFGDYGKDRNCMIFSGLLNIVVSILLVFRLDVTGVQIGSLVAFLPITYGRMRFVVKGFFDKSIRKYIVKQTFFFCVFLCEIIVSYYITRNYKFNFTDGFKLLAVYIVVPMVFNIVLFIKDPNFKELCKYIKKAGLIIGSKVIYRN